MMLYTGVHFAWQMTACNRRILRGWSGSSGAPCTASFARFSPVRYTRLSAEPVSGTATGPVAVGPKLGEMVSGAARAGEEAASAA